MGTDVLPSWWAVAMHFTYFAGLASVLGGSLAYLLAIRPGLDPEASPLTPEQCAQLHRRSARLLRRAGWFFVLAVYGLFAIRLTPDGEGVTLGAALGATLSPTAVGQFVSTPSNPDEWVTFEGLIVLQNVFYALVIVLLVALASRRVRDRLPLVAKSAILLTASGSAAASVPTSFAGETLDDLETRVFDQLHILAGATWVGGLLFLGLMTRRYLLGGSAGAFWTGVWQRFSVLALGTVGVVLVSGMWLTWKNVGSIAELWTTTFGRFLVAKLLLVMLLMAAGAYNQLVLTPRIVRDVQVSRATDPPAVGRGRVPGFPRVVVVETLLGLCVLIIVPFLTAGSARAQAGSPPASALNAGLLALSVCLVAALGGSLYATHRLSIHLVRQADLAAAASS